MNIIFYTIIGIKILIASLVCGFLIGAALTMLLSNWPGVQAGATMLLSLPAVGWFVNRFYKWK